MRRLFYFLGILSIVMFACNIPSVPTQPTATLPPVETEIPGPTETLVPTVCHLQRTVILPRPDFGFRL
jgi:hypothetical protein